MTTLLFKENYIVRMKLSINLFIEMGKEKHLQNDPKVCLLTKG